MKIVDRHIKEAINLWEAVKGDTMLFEGNDELSKKVKEMIDNDENWEINNYDSFADSISHCTKHPGFVTMNPSDYYKDNNATTFKQKGLSIGFALVPQEDGNVDIQAVHNNEPEVGGIVDSLLACAKRHGGTQLDHFEGILSDFYGRNGFEEYDRMDWDDQYAPKDWDYEKYGRPDVVMRRLPHKEEIQESFNSLLNRMNNSKRNLLF